MLLQLAYTNMVGSRSAANGALNALITLMQRLISVRETNSGDRERAGARAGA